MSFYATLPKDWIDIKIDSRLIFINMKENLVSYHPPMDLSNIGAFLNLYKINKKKEEILKLLHNPKSTSLSKETTGIKSSEIKKDHASNGLSMDIDNNGNLDQNSQNSKPVKPVFDSNPITDGNIFNNLYNPLEHKLKILDGLLSCDQDISFILKQAVLEKYNTLPNYEYSTDLDQKAKSSIFKCHIKIREEHRLCTGISDLSKNKAKENAIKEGLKVLVPDIYRKLKKNKTINHSSMTVLSKLDENQNQRDTSLTISDNSEITSNDIKKSFNELDTPNGGVSDNSNRYSSADLDFNPSTDLNMNNGHCVIFEGVIPRKDYLSKKRKNDADYMEDEEKIYVSSKKAKKEKKSKKSSEDCLKSNLNFDEDENVEYIYGGCLNEDIFSNLAIDDPLVVDKYLKTSNFTPLSILNTFRMHHPKIDVTERTFARNDGIKFENIDNNSYTKIALESNKLNIRVECSHDNKKLAREFCAQKFLNKLYKRKFTKWVELVKYYEDRRFINDNFLK